MSSNKENEFFKNQDHFLFFFFNKCKHFVWKLKKKKKKNYFNC